MKAGEFRELSEEEKQRKLEDLREAAFNLRFQLESGQLENTAKLKQTKREIARLKTVLREAVLKNNSKTQTNEE